MAVLSVEPKSHLLYEQVREQLRELCRQEAGTALPPLRRLSRELEVNHLTVSRALRDLEHEGLVEVLPRKGAFVRKNPFEVRDANIELVTFYHQRQSILDISSNIIRGIEEAGGTGIVHGTTVTTPPLPDVSRFLMSLKERKVRAVLFLGVHYLKYPDSLDEANFIRAISQQMPSVIIGSPHPILDLDVVYGDPRPQLREYLERCYAIGLRRFACLGVHENRPSNRERFDAFKNFLLQNGVCWQENYALPLSSTIDEDVRSFFDIDPLPQVIIAMDTAYAIAAVLEANRRGLKSGRDIHFLTFASNESLVHSLLQDVTVIHTQENEVGKRAYQLAREKLENPQHNREPVTLRVATRFLNQLLPG